MSVGGNRDRPARKPDLSKIVTFFVVNERDSSAFIGHHSRFFLVHLHDCGVSERSGAWIKLRTNMEQEFVIGVTSPVHAASMRCSWAFTRTKSSSSSAKVKNGFVPRIRDELFRLSRRCKLPSATSRICLRFRSPSRRRKETLGRRSSRSPARREPAGTWPPRAPSRAARPARLACAA